MRIVMLKLLRRALWIGLLLVPAVATYYIAKTAYVPGPIRLFHSHAESFRAFAERVRAGEPVNAERSRSIGCYECTISVDGDYLFFYISNLPPEPVQLIGCRLHQGHQNPEQHPSRILARPAYAHYMTYRFEMLDNDWFYWEYDF